MLNRGTCVCNVVPAAKRTTQRRDVVALKPVSEQDTWDHIFGSGLLSDPAYDWWVTVRATGENGWSHGEAPDGWAVFVEVMNPRADGTTKVEVSHAVLMRAVRKIAGRKVKAESWGQPSAACARECRNLLFNPDAVDFDGATADEVLQVATLGCVYYG